MQIVALRLTDLARLLHARYGPQLPDDDAGREDMMPALHHLACLPRPRPAIMRWLEVWAPWMPVAEAAELAANAIADPRRYKADTLGWAIRLTVQERDSLAITTIGAIGMNKAARAKRRRERDRERKAKQRRAKGAKPRKQYEAQSIERTKPWLAEGISRRTWYRRRNGTGASSDTGPATA